jgi:hypothetical protein
LVETSAHLENAQAKFFPVDNYSTSVLALSNPENPEHICGVLTTSLRENEI